MSSSDLIIRVFDFVKNVKNGLFQLTDIVSVSGSWEVTEPVDFDIIFGWNFEVSCISLGEFAFQVVDEDVHRVKVLLDGLFFGKFFIIIEKCVSDEEVGGSESSVLLKIWKTLLKFDNLLIFFDAFPELFIENVKIS